MVQTRRSTKKPIAKVNIKTKKIAPEKKVGKRKKVQNNLDRCKNWIQQQKKEKLKVQPEELNSTELDDEERNPDLDAVSV